MSEPLYRAVGLDGNLSAPWSWFYLLAVLRGRRNRVDIDPNGRVVAVVKYEPRWQGNQTSEAADVLAPRPYDTPMYRLDFTAGTVTKIDGEARPYAPTADECEAAWHTLHGHDKPMNGGDYRLAEAALRAAHAARQRYGVPAVTA